MIFVSSRPTDARPSEPVVSASPDWNLMLSNTGLVPPFESSMLTVPSTLRRRIVLARYWLRPITTAITIPATIAAAITASMIFF